MAMLLHLLLLELLFKYTQVAHHEPLLNVLEHRLLSSTLVHLLRAPLVAILLGHLLSRMILFVPWLLVLVMLFVPWLLVLLILLLMLLLLLLLVILILLLHLLVVLLPIAHGGLLELLVAAAGHCS